ncbi:Reverse transcriptase, putative, partial [Ixodes scapularis]
PLAIALWGFRAEEIARHLVLGPPSLFERNCLLSDFKHEFGPNRSRETAFAIVGHHVSNELDNRTPADIIQLDFCSAFDSLDYSILPQKIVLPGIRGPLLLWPSRFLIGRFHLVLYHGRVTEEFVVTSGVPQGSIMYANEIPSSRD